MPTKAKRNSTLTSKFYRDVGIKGWRKSNYTTDTWKYPVLRQWVASQLTKKGKTILSVGCGSGELEKSLRKLNYKVIGLDFSFEMLKGAARFCRDSLIQADGDRLPFAADSFDAVILPESLGHLDAQVAFREVRRVLKKKGRILVTTYPMHRGAHALYNKYDMAGLCDLLIQAGFRVKAKKLLRPKQKSVEELSQENRCELLYVMAVKEASINAQEISDSTLARGAA